MPEKIVVPAQAGTQASFYGGLTVTLPWPLFVEDSSIPHCGECWIPACAGMTGWDAMGGGLNCGE